MAKGIRRCTTARPALSKIRARFSEHGISGLLFRSTTKTDMGSFLPPTLGGPRKGLVTRLNRLAQATPLANVGRACSAHRTARYSQLAFNDERQSSELRWHSLVP
jgi:hypothetical protein